MNHEPDAATCLRRTNVELTRVVSERPDSGLNLGRFCRIHNLARSVLTRRLNKMPDCGTASTPATDWVRTEVVPSPSPYSSAAPTGLVLTGSRRIEPAPSLGHPELKLRNHWAENATPGVALERINWIPVSSPQGGPPKSPRSSRSSRPAAARASICPLT